MPVSTRINGRRRFVASGDLTQQISVQLRTLTPPAADGVDATETLTGLKTVWAMPLTEDGSEFFDGVNLELAYTHVFIIRFIANTVFTRSGRLSAQERISWKGRQFQVVNVENLEERDEFLKIKAFERGAESIGVNT